MSDILILDGGLGTSLEQKYGVKFEGKPLWSSDLLVSDPDTLLACQRDFGEVPVDIILTATYQVSIEGFSKTQSADAPQGISPNASSQYINKAVTIANKAKKAEAGVALSIGPYGACMIPSQEYSGVYDAAHSSLESLQAWHSERLELFAQSIGDVDKSIRFVALETVPRVDEIIAMRKALAPIDKLCHVPFWISCLFPGHENTLPDGSTVAQALKAMLDPSLSTAQPWGIGINCTKTWKLDPLLQLYEEAIEELLATNMINSWPALVLYPDGTNGEVYNTETQTWDLPADTSTEAATSWEKQVSSAVFGTRSRGKWSHIVVGGCCMASSEHIKRLREVLVSK